LYGVVAVAGFTGLLESHPPFMPQEFPVLPVADGADHPAGKVVVLTMADELPVAEPYVPVAVDTLVCLDE
jgi:hypothetical protein